MKKQNWKILCLAQSAVVEHNFNH